jgi:hypothetical protein
MGDKKQEIVRAAGMTHRGLYRPVKSPHPGEWASSRPIDEVGGLLAGAVLASGRPPDSSSLRCTSELPACKDTHRISKAAESRGHGQFS